MQISTGLQDILADAIDTEINGSTAQVRWYTSSLTTKLASALLATPSAFGASSSGTITLNGVPLEDTSPAAAGTCVRLCIYKTTAATSGAFVLQFGVNPTGSPDVTMANNVIATTDTVQLTSLTVTVPAGTPDVT
jgi:hypothetical protein